jgi:hypothetical protein
MAWFPRFVVAPVYRLAFGPAAASFDPGQERDRRDAATLPRGLVVMADGVGGLELCGTGLAHIVGAAKLPYAVVVVPWGHGIGRWHADLTNVANCRAWAKSVVETVRSFKAAHPDAPVFLVAKSGGSGVVVQALESLEANTIERVIFLAPALSPAYDLTAALRAIRRNLVVFWSPFDIVILGAGTRLFGTIDRVRSVGAGLVGFKPPLHDKRTDIDRDSYEKLHQVRWRPTMAATGYLGGHFGPDSPLFLRKYVVPLLRVDDSPPC